MALSETPGADRCSDPSQEGPGEAYREGGLPSRAEDSRDPGGSWPGDVLWVGAPDSSLRVSSLSRVSAVRKLGGSERHPEADEHWRR